ncbi:MAG: SAF domain-containing protein [Pirellulaceae bacterium]
MSHTSKLLIAVGLGALAAVLNFMSISQKQKPVKFATVSKAVKQGEQITTDLLTSVEVPAHFAQSLQKSVVPFSEMAVLSGKYANRDIEAGELILWEDAPIRGPQYDLQAGETAVFIDVGNSAVSNIAVGELVSFRIYSDETGTDARWLGPFRLVTVGDKRRLGDRVERFDTISVAVPEDEKDPIYQSLQAFIDRQSRRSGEPIQMRAHVQ